MLDRQLLRFISTQPLWKACKENDLDTLDALLSTQHYNFHECLPVVRGQFLDAIKVVLIRGYISCLELFLKHGVDVDLPIMPCGSTALFVAAANGRVDCMELLIRNNANINFTNKYHETPLFAACESGQPKSVQFLIDKGLDVNKQSTLIREEIRLTSPPQKKIYKYER